MSRAATEDGFRIGLRDGELLIPICTACAAVLDYSQRFCAACGGDTLGWRKASGRGWLRSIVEIGFSYFADYPAPYRIAFVRLEEGPHLLGPYESDSDCDPDDQRVRAEFSGGRLLFRPDRL
jgi:uncharacterized OB-fold protein